MKEIKEISKDFWLAEVDIEELHEQDKNANVLKKEAFNQLKKNIEKENHLESIPLCVLQNEKIYIISGHHRVRAARAAGIKTIVILLYTRHLTKSQIRAKQIAHNRIHGEDNLQILSEMFFEIEQEEDRQEAFIDLSGLEQMDMPIKKLENIEENKKRNSLINVSLIFFPNQLELLDEALLACCEKMKKQDLVYVGSIDDWERFKTAMRIIKTKAKIIAVGTALNKMCSIVLEHYGAQSIQESSNWQDAAPSGQKCN